MATEKLTLVVEPKTGEALRQWAQEEQRPIANLLRVIVLKSLAEHRQRQGVQAA